MEQENPHHSRVIFNLNTFYLGVDAQECKARSSLSNKHEEATTLFQKVDADNYSIQLEQKAICYSKREGLKLEKGGVEAGKNPSSSALS